MGIDATLCMLKDFIPNIRQGSSLSKISTGVEIVWEKPPPTLVERYFGLAYRARCRKKAPALSDI
jgi:hypothetical protein